MKLKAPTSAVENELWIKVFTTCVDNLLKLPQEYANMAGGIERGLAGCAVAADKAVELFRQRYTTNSTTECTKKIND